MYDPIPIGSLAFCNVNLLLATHCSTKVIITNANTIRFREYIAAKCGPFLRRETESNVGLLDSERVILSVREEVFDYFQFKK